MPSDEVRVNHPVIRLLRSAINICYTSGFRKGIPRNDGESVGLELFRIIGVTVIARSLKK